MTAETARRFALDAPRPSKRVAAMLLGCALAMGAATGSGLAQGTAADFYRGRTVTIVVSSPPGGGYDAIARAVARHLGRHMEGQPTFIVQNMPGAGGIVATNHLATVAPKDGSLFAQLQPNVAFEPLMGTKTATYDATRLNWLGTPAYETGVFTVWHATGIKSLEDARKRELSVGVPGVSSGPSLYARILAETLGLKLKLIAGYKGQAESQIAMERGETDAYPNFYNNLVAFRPQWLKDGKLLVLVQYGAEKEPGLPAVPFALDLATRDDDRALMVAAFAPLSLGRPFAAPPGVPPDRIAMLRSGLNATFADAQFIEDVEKGGLKVNKPRSGEELHAIIDQVYKTPAKVIDRLRKLE